MKNIQDIEAPQFVSTSSLFGKGGLLEPKDEWDKLSMAAKAEMMRVAVNHGIYDLQTIRQKYNEFAEGGNLFKGGGSTDADVVDWLIQEEGFNKKPEDIGDGKMTLGSGLTSSKWHGLYKRRGNKWSAADNRMAVAEEVASRRRWAEQNIPNWDTLPKSSQKALLSYKYNYDFNRSNSPKLFAALEAGNLQEAARQMDATSKDPKFKKGLQARRKREQEWFLSDVVSRPTGPTPIYEMPVSTAVYNPYIQQVGNTRIAPIMVPDDDSYITTHRLTESEERRKRLQESMEAFSNFKKLMQLTSVDNTATPTFMPTTGNTFLDGIIGLTKAEGGSIHIKPSHRGRLTELKKRTGKTEAELYRTGGPAVRKMITFARSARKWKHGFGGNLFDGTSQDSQKMQIGLDVQGWPDYTTQQIIAYGEENERRRKAIQDAYLNFVTESNDATAVANGRPQNQHLVDKAVQGAKANAAWEKEHPNLTAWGNTLATIPFIVASAPALDAAASTAMGQSVLSGINYIANAAKATPYISKVLPWAEAALATGSATHSIHEMKKGTFTPITALEVSPLAPPVIGIGNNLYLPHLREHLYASKAPIGYDGILPAAKRMAEGILSGRRADIESPFWFNSESAKTLGESYAFVPTKIPEAEKAQYIKEFGQRALKARADIWRMYNRLPQKYNTFAENDRYPGAYTATEDIKALKWVPFPDKNVDPGDFVNSVGGNVGLPQITNLGKGLPDAGYTSKEFGITTLSDLWDLYPFSRPNDRLISRIQRGYQKAFNSTETPKLNWLKPLDKKLAKFEVGKLVNAKPIMVKNDIPWTMDRKLITDANGNLNFRTSYTQGFHSDNVLPQSVIDWKTGKPLIEETDIRFNPEDYNFLKMKLTTKSRKK